MWRSGAAAATRQIARSSRRGPLLAAAASSLRYASTQTPTAAAAAAPAASAAASAARDPTAAELDLLTRSKPTPEQLAKFSAEQAKAAAARREWEEWDRKQAKLGPPVSDKEALFMKIVVAAFGGWALYRFYLWTQIVSQQQQDQQQRGGLSLNTVDEDAIPAYGSVAPSGPSPTPVGFQIPPMDPSVSTMPAIFASVLDPLLSFDSRAEEFITRKVRAEQRVDDLNRRRKLGAVSSKEIESAEVEARRVRTEERLVFQPRLAFLRELYKIRSLELMQRSQWNAEQIVAASSKDPALRQALEAEMAEFQALAKNNQHVLTVVEKYQIQGTTTAMKKIIQQA